MLGRSAVSMVLLLAVALPAAAEVSTRECIRFAQLNGQSGYRARIPASATRDLVTMDFEIRSASDAIFDVALFFQDSQTAPESRARYALHLNGGNAHRLGQPLQYFIRTPTHTDGTIHMRYFFQDIPAGVHQVIFKVVNTSSTPIDLAGAWITPIFVDAAESGLVDQRLITQTVGSGWTTLGEITVPSLDSRSLYLYSYVRGTAAGEVEFRGPRNTGCPYDCVLNPNLERIPAPVRNLCNP